MNITRRKAGFALISVLALVAVLVILLGALMGTNRTAFGLLKVSQANDRIDRTISSVYSLCRFRLEHDYKWGKTFEGRSGDWSHLRWTEVASRKDVQKLVGRDSANLTSFEVEICNNLKTDGEVATLKDVRTEDRRDSIPAGFCRLEIKVEGDGHLEGVEVMVRNPGLVGGVCLANDLLSIDAEELDMLTRDPVKNQARSLGETRLTGLRNFMEGDSRSEFISYDGDRSDVSQKDPLIWAGSGNSFRTDPDEEFRHKAPFKRAHSNIDFKDERFVDEAKSLFDIPDVGLDDLLEVRAADDAPKHKERIPAGIYRFEQYGSPPVRVLTRRAPAADMESVAGPVEQFWWTKEPTDIGTDNSRVANWVNADPANGSQQVTNPSNVDSKYVSINGGRALVDLGNRRVVLDSSRNFEVNGDFSLIGSGPATEGNPTGSQDLRQINPAIYFGDPHSVAASGDFSVSGAANAVDASPEKGSLRSTGRINIQGDISGSTTIASKGDLTIAPGRFFDAEGNKEINFSLFSEENVSILPPPILEDADDRAVVESTGEIIDTNPDRVHEALNVSEKDLRFTGLIYARKSVNIDLQDTRREAGTRRNFLLEGAIVAKEGELRLSNAGEVELVYNPQFVDRLIPSVVTAGQRRIEITGWRTTKPSAFAADLGR